MAVQTVKNSLMPKKQTFSAFITADAVKTKINQMIAGKDGDKFITSIISLVSNNPALAECEHSTILSAALLGESLKLSASQQLGQFYLVPFKEKDKNGEVKRTVATFVLGYKGYIQLAIRSGQYKKLNVLAIKEGELIKYDPLEETIEVKLIEDEAEREKAKTIGYYAMFEYMNGFRKTLYWSKEKMQTHAQTYSQSYMWDVNKKTKYSFWSKDFDAMAYKTMLRQLISKWGIMSVDFQRAYENDTAYINENNEPKYIDNVIEAEPIDPDMTQVTDEGKKVETQPQSENETEPQQQTLTNDDPFNNLE